ncbi:MAG: GxxExxY protein [Candidatus Omnitrophica bacterium]|nr:GxxExxY protein [Candidatus Omnitrophota bacterium]
MNKILYKELSYKVQGTFFEVYKAFGNGFKETIYHNALIEEFKVRELKTDSQKRINIYYRGKRVGTYVPDFVIEDSIIVEIKCKPILTQADEKQFWHYLKGSDYKVGYLVNFGALKKVVIIRRVYDTARRSSHVFA